MEASKSTKRTTKTTSEEKPESKPKTKTSDELGEFAYAGERSDWSDDRDDVPGSPDHLGESPYAGGLT